MMSTGTSVWYLRAILTTSSIIAAVVGRIVTPSDLASSLVVASHVLRNCGTSYGTTWYVFSMYARSAAPPTEPVSPKMHAYLVYMYGVHRQLRKVFLAGSSRWSSKFLYTSQSSVSGTFGSRIVPSGPSSSIAQPRSPRS